MSSEGLPRECRLRKRSDFERVYEEGSKAVTSAFVLFARRNETSRSRLGVTATRKLGNSVRRNRARRLVREAFRRCREELPAGFDYVVVARGPLLSLKPGEIRPLLIRSASRATTPQDD